MSVNELAKGCIERYASVNLDIIHEPARPGENMRPIPDTGKIEALGFEAQVPFAQGCAATRRWVAAELGVSVDGDSDEIL
jgi:nucleoside-diphosphate-sugar epimerase